MQVGREGGNWDEIVGGERIGWVEDFFENREKGF